MCGLSRVHPHAGCCSPKSPLPVRAVSASCSSASALLAIHPPSPLMLGREDHAALAAAAAAEVGLDAKLGAAAGELSGGQRRKLSVALAFVGNPSGVRAQRACRRASPCLQRRRPGMRAAKFTCPAPLCAAFPPHLGCFKSSPPMLDAHPPLHAVVILDEPTSGMDPYTRRRGRGAGPRRMPMQRVQHTKA